MTNYMPIIAEQILNIELYNYFKIKCTDKKYPRNQTYYLGYDGLHHRKDEVNTDNELLNKIITGQAEIIYIKNSQDKLTNKNTFQIYAIKESWKLGNFEVMEWKLLYYIMNLFYKNHDISQTIEFNEFEQYYHYTTNMITTENRILSSLYNKKILTSYQKYKDKKSMIIISTNFLELWNFHKSNYIYTAEYISYFKSKASFPFFNYIIYQLKNEKTKTIELNINEFKRICCINEDAYSLFTPLKNKIITPILNDIENATKKCKYGIIIFFNKIKTKNEITLKFTIIRKDFNK